MNVLTEPSKRAGDFVSKEPLELIQNRNLNTRMINGSEPRKSEVRAPVALREPNRQFQINPSDIAPDSGPLSIYKL